jgi:signal transduction histidine kinase
MVKGKPQLRLLSYGVIAYMLLAFTWWSVLLFTKNRDAFAAKREYLHLIMAAQDQELTDEIFYASPQYKSLEKGYRRQEWMILGEALVFVVSLVIGVWLINRGYNKEMLAAQQRRNFLLSITHELKSPIASIRLVLETFRKRKLTEPQVEKLSNNGLKEAERLNTLVTDLLLSAKLEAAYSPYMEPLNLAILLEEMVHKVQEKSPKAEIHFHQDGHIPNINGDKPGLTSVFINLLENAVKYSSGHAILHTTISSQQDDLIVIEIADNGIGIPDREKKLIFEKFYRVGSEDTRTTKGTGLGLYIVNEIIRTHEGYIQVLDNEPKGTIFKITLPVKQDNSTQEIIEKEQKIKENTKM